MPHWQPRATISYLSLHPLIQYFLILNVHKNHLGSCWNANSSWKPLAQALPWGCSHQTCRVELQEGSLGLQNLLTQTAVPSIELLECSCNRAIDFYHASDPPAVACPASMLPFLSGLLLFFCVCLSSFPNTLYWKDYWRRLGICTFQMLS